MRRETAQRAGQGGDGCISHATPLDTPHDTLYDLRVI